METDAFAPPASRSTAGAAFATFSRLYRSWRVRACPAGGRPPPPLRERLDVEKAKTTAAQRKPVRKTLKTLLVEDDQNERELLAGFLRMSGFAVDTAGDGCDALEHLRTRERPDVVLLDMGLPRFDGAATAREIRRDPANAGMRILAVTGHTPDEYDLDQGPSGIDRWFHKPLDPVALLRELNGELQSI